MAVKRFKSRTDKVVRVASTSGHVRLIGKDWVEIANEELQNMAYANGCISDDIIVNTDIQESIYSGALSESANVAELKEKVRTALRTAVEENNLDAFTKHGKPKVAYIRDAVDEKVPNHILDSVWWELKDDIPVKEVDEDKELRSDIT